jgi:hypothetical protein
VTATASFLVKEDTTYLGKHPWVVKPGGVFRGQKDSDGGDITWLADAAGQRLRESELFELDPMRVRKTDTKHESMLAI